MVGYDSLSTKKLTSRDYIFAGAFSGLATRCLSQPLDVLKIRFQLQVEPVKSTCVNSKYTSMKQAAKIIYKEEGPKAFWKGHIPAQYLSLSYGAFQFASFEFLTKQTWHLLPNCISRHYDLAINFTCGALAGSFATVGSFPFDVIRTRFVGQGEPKLYQGMKHGLQIMIKKEGYRSLYKGLLPTLLQAAPNSGAQFAFYKLFVKFWDLITNTASQTSALKSTICGATAGIAAKIIVYPFDLVKKRLQVQGFEEARRKFGSVPKYNGIIHCLRTIIKEERILGLYKGLNPSILKAGVTTASHFLFYEEICKLLNYMKNSL